ncbi:PREDICTED: SH3 domain-binding protein 5-like isoform X1 [Branchiostoma belcheri]|uniref:SH3 domain-binding protein 5-like n=1 Tax=Branchiostoma belcheri TaxID=7741 RepID=A0A6P4Z5P6_BRABE|nr:PREDICTED: SH3 domain-binding protein 5-like isoform X1 [Branchiostoma belcheri]
MASPQREEELDPRIQEELETLNQAADEINSLELELDDSRAAFRQLLTESTQRLNVLAKKLGSCVDRARPYYQARREAREAQIETQKAVQRFDRATSMHNAAKEMVAVAENGLLKEGHTFDTTWQEMLNHATTKVNEAEKERFISEIAHQATARKFNESEQRVKMLQKALKRAIVKSSLATRRSLLQLNALTQQHQLALLPYFEMKAKIQEDLDERKLRVERLEKGVLKSKAEYSLALKNLEEISEGIHRQRKERRGSGVGAEAGSPESREDPQGVGENVHLPRPSSLQGKGDAGTAVQKDIHDMTGKEDGKVEDNSKENLTSPKTQEKPLLTSPVAAGPSASSPVVSSLSEGIVLSSPRNVDPVRIKLQFSPVSASKISKDSGIADDSVSLNDNKSMEGYAYGISPPKSHSSPGIASSLQRPASNPGPYLYAPRSHSGVLGGEYKTLPHTHSGTSAGSPLRPPRAATKSLDLTESDASPMDDGSIFTSADLLAIKADLERKDSVESLTETGSVSSLSDGVGMGMSLSLSRLSLRLRERSDSI